MRLSNPFDDAWYTVPKSLRLSCFPVPISWTSSVSPLQYHFFGEDPIFRPRYIFGNIDNPTSEAGKAAARTRIFCKTSASVSRTNFFAKAWMNGSTSVIFRGSIHWRWLQSPWNYGYTEKHLDLSGFSAKPLGEMPERAAAFHPSNSTDS